VRSRDHLLTLAMHRTVLHYTAFQRPTGDIELVITNDALHPEAVSLQKQRLYHKYGTKTYLADSQCGAARSACELKIACAWEDYAALHDVIRHCGEESTRGWGAKVRAATCGWHLELK
jgi:hypothetical protein